MALPEPWHIVANFFFVFLIGSFSGLVELLSRYESFRRMKNIPAAWVYIGINGSIAMLVYFLMEFSQLKFSIANYNSGPTAKVILAGTGAMILLRSSIASIKVSDKAYDVGLAPIIYVLLNYVNRSYDKENSKIVLEEVGKIMKDINFEAAKKNLSIPLIVLMKSLSEEEVKKIGDRVAQIANNTQLNDKTKALALGLHLSSVTGTELLKAIVAELDDILKSNLESNPTSIETLLDEYSPDS